MSTNESNMRITRITKEENASLRWVAKAATTDIDRPILTGVNVSDDAVVGCDGFRLHAIPPMPGIPGPATLNFGKIPARAIALEPEEIEGRYPDLKQIIPNDKVVEPDAVVCFNPKYLREALQGMEGMVELRIRIGHPIEVLGDHKGAPRYALIMPVHNGSTYGAAHPSTWRPGDKS